MQEIHKMERLFLIESDYISRIETTLNFGPCTMMKKDSSLDQLKRVKRSDKNVFIHSDQTKRMAIPSFANYILDSKLFLKFINLSLLFAALFLQSAAKLFEHLR